jgi:hypothetical protein
MSREQEASNVKIWGKRLLDRKQKVPNTRPKKKKK